MTTEGKKPVTNAFERHAQTALVLLLVALLLWVGNTTQSTAISVAEMRVEIAYLKAAVDQPHEHNALQEAISDCRQRVTSLEEREHTEER